MRTVYPVMVSEEATLGRRERKKRETRRAIRRAAVRLAHEHGVEHVTVEQISEAADIAPRTFFNYFSGKDEALIGGSEETTEELGERLLARPAAEPPLRALRAALRGSEFVTGAEDRREEMLDRHRLIAENPSLLPHQLARYAELERMFARVMAQRLDVDPDRDLRPALFAATAATVLRVTLQRWTVTTESTVLEIMEEVFDLVESRALLDGPPGAVGGGGQITSEQQKQEVSR